ncbi:DUF4097 family beta strand repeat-containing protein [Actinorugispora endophytica]|uniref:Putative adhesin n=1 Tax=Actinorugispora endophytica TaxID=1605990 RepID=A0A4R6UVP0_9ACTN|nr:DUF4097 family beta strand repeat-containing protein [Actinorugispora endophytica]TDQ51410.1 putative adhesin [Actinorugispora endophytica]
MRRTVRSILVGGFAVGGVAALTGCGLAVDVSAGVTEEGATDTYTGVDALELSSRDGAVTITGGDVSEVTVERVLRYTGDTPPGETVTEDGGTLGVVAEGCGDGGGLGLVWCDIDYTVTVPVGTAVSVDSADGSVTVDGTGASLDARTRDGEVVIRGAAGRVDAYTADGSVTLSGVEAGAVTAETSDGGVEVTDTVADTLSVTTRDGRVDLSGAEAGSIAAETSDGGIEVTGAVFDTLTARSNDGALAVTATAAFDSIDASTNDGPVEVRTPADSGPYAVETSTGDGRVTVDVPESDEAESAITLTTRDGSIDVL